MAEGGDATTTPEQQVATFARALRDKYGDASNALEDEHLSQAIEQEVRDRPPCSVIPPHLVAPILFARVTEPKSTCIQPLRRTDR